MNARSFALALAAVLLAALTFAQAPQDQPQPAPAYPAAAPQDQPPQPAPAQNNDQDVVPLNTTIRVNVVGRSTQAVNYRHRSGSTHINFAGTSLMPEGTGQAKIDTDKAGRLVINTSLHHMRKPTSFGPQYLTYVLWAITPEGRPANLGEVLPNNGGNADPHVTTDLQAFGMIVTAEPYFAVTRPSDMVVMENVVRPDTEGWEEHITAKYEAMDREAYTVDLHGQELPATSALAKTPLDLLEAMNAVAIARAAGAEQYAPDALARAVDFLNKAEDYLKRKQGVGPIGTVARGATQQAEDARILTIRRKQQEAIETERREQEQRAEEARARAAAEAQRAAEARAEAAQQAQQRQLAEQQQQQAEQARQQADLARQQAEAARQAALQQQQQAQAEAERAQLAAQQAEQQREAMRQRLIQQLNTVLQTRDTPKGLVATMPDVLFAFNNANLKPDARERLAKVAGILLAYPDLKLRVEGYTDNIGSDQYNQVLSEKRAANVRDYLVSQGVPLDNVTAQGFGMADPVAPNNTAKGRQQNRRVELVLSGESIGYTAAPAGAATTPPPPAPDNSPAVPK